MRVFITLILFVLLASNMGIKEESISPSCLQMDIFIIGDFSTSIDGNERFVADAMLEFTDRFDLSDYGLKIGIIGFGSEASLITPLTSDREVIISGINKYLEDEDGGTTNMTAALNMGLAEFYSKSARPDYRKLIVLISDGDPDSSNEVYALASQIKSMGIGICGVLVQASVNKPEYMRIISSEFCYVESDYKNLVSELQKLDICM